MRNQIKLAMVRYGIAFGACAAATSFLYMRVPHNIELVVVPEVLFLITLTIPILLWSSLSSGKQTRKIAAAASCAIWIIGIIAGLNIKPGSNFIYLPDALLLVGFIPLLHRFRYSWPWFVFGAFNFGIGIFLQAIAFLSDTLFPQRLVIAKHHLCDYHPAITWCTLGAIAIIWGLGRLLANQFAKVRSRLRL